MQGAETQGHRRAFGHRAFLIAIERIESVVIEACLVGGNEAGGLLERERRGAGAISGINDGEVLSSSGAGSDDRSGIVGRGLSVKIDSAGGQVSEEDEGSRNSSAGNRGPGDRNFTRVLIQTVAGIGAVVRGRCGPAASAVGVAILAVSVFDVGDELRTEG